MPKSIHGVKLTVKEHRMWKDVYASSHSGAQATGVVKKVIAKRKAK